MEGFIYIARNDAYSSNLLKIGRSIRLPSDRLKELSNATGVPGGFRLLHAEWVPDCIAAERDVHTALREFRHSKEFFLVDADYAIKKIREIADHIKDKRNSEVNKDPDYCNAELFPHDSIKPSTQSRPSHRSNDDSSFRSTMGIEMQCIKCATTFHVTLNRHENGARCTYCHCYQPASVRW